MDPVDWQAGRNFLMSRQHAERGVLMEMRHLVKHEGRRRTKLPKLRNLREEAQVRFIDTNGQEVAIDRVLITWQD